MQIQGAVGWYPHTPPRETRSTDGDAPQRPFEAGVSAAWRKLIAQANMTATHIHVATIEGETGSGKQTLARYLFSLSPLSSARFQRYDAREWLLIADPATLEGFVYLDRVDLLAGPGQGLLLTLLKALQDRLTDGSTDRRPMIVTSSQTPLRQLAGQGQMLPDLVFRLTAVRFAIPPLRARKEDIVPLAHSLLQRICARYQHKPVALGQGVLARLLQHDWPGNVRELESVLEAALLEATDDVIRPGDLSLDRRPYAPVSSPPALEPPANAALDTCIRRHVQHVLELNRGNKLRAARQLGISRSTLYRILSSEAIQMPG